MSAVRSIRRLLALITVLIPVDMARPEIGAGDETTPKTEVVEVVFRHFV
ncbi:hypothetical protein [Methylobacterium segetis]|nr:hypothetical protein [Methylobacterium segetis]